MKLFGGPKQYVLKSAAAVRRAARSTVAIIVCAAKVILKPIGFREVLLLGGAALLGIGTSSIYPPAAYIVPGLVLVGVAVFGVRT